MAKRSHVVTIDVSEAMWGEMNVATETQGLGKSDLLRTGIWRMRDWARDDERGVVTGLQGNVTTGPRWKGWDEVYALVSRRDERGPADRDCETATDFVYEGRGDLHIPT